MCVREIDVVFLFLSPVRAGDSFEEPSLKLARSQSSARRGSKVLLSKI